MKKTLSLVLSAIMVFSIFACVGMVRAEAAKTIQFFTFETPEGGYSVCEYTNGYWSYEYDDEGGVSEKFFVYDNFDLWEDGCVINVSYLYDGTDVMDVEYTCIDGEYVDNEGNVLDTETLWYSIDEQYDEPWSVGEESLIIELDGATCTVPVEITETPVKSVEFVAVEPLTLRERVDGFGSDDYFYYDYESLFYKNGNVLNVEFKDGTTKVYTSNDYTFFDENGEEMSYYDVVACDTQFETQWTELGEYSVEIYVMGYKLNITVTLVENPVESVSFNTESPLVYYENTCGNWMYIYDGDYEEEVFIYTEPLFIDGSSITVNYKDGTSSVYYFDAEEIDYINENGEGLAHENICFYSNQEDEPWYVGEHSFTMELFDRKCDVPVTIVENLVENFEFEPAKKITFKYAEGGEWLTGEDEYGDETAVYIYDTSIYSPYQEGNKITIELKDGSFVTYIYDSEAGAFLDENGEVMPYDYEISYIDIQMFYPFDETSPYNYIGVEFMGLYGAIPVYIENGLTPAPELSYVYNEIGKVCVEWEPAAGAVAYRVYRKVGNAKSWEYLGTTDDNYFEDTKEIKDGKKYKYTVRGVNVSGEFGEFDKAGLSVEYVAPVQGVKLENVDGKIKVFWDDYNGVECYVFKYAEGDDDWSFVSSAPGAGYYVLDSEVESGKEYNYAILVSRNGYDSGYEIYKIKCLETPKINSATNTTSGINIKWDSVKGAESYRVYRNNASGGWTLIGKTDKTSFTDTAVVGKSGNTYKYTVKAVSGKTVSGYNKKGVSLKRVDTVTELTSIANGANGIALKWNAIKGADSYRVYRRVGNGAFEYIGSTKTPAYTDKAVKSNSGTTYNYTIKAVSGKTNSDYNRQGWSIVRLVAPSLKSAENYPTGAKVTWGKVKGAEGYNLYRKTKSTSWTKVATIKGNATTSFIDEKAESGILYTYTVRAINGKYQSPYVAEGISLKYLAAPKITAKVTETGVKLSWNKPVGTKDFRIYRIAEGEKAWTKLKDTTSLSYTDTTAKNGVKYTYAVRARNGAVASNLNKATLEFITTPKVKALANKTNGIEIKWGKVSAVDGYRVYRKTGNGAWVNLGDVSAEKLSFLDETAVAGETYTYTVRAFDGKYFSAYIASAEIIRVAEPEVSLQIQENNVAIGFKPVEGAEKYYVYRKLDGGWERIAAIKSEDAVTEESGYAVYLDENVDVTADYYYTVKAYNGSYASSFVTDCSLSSINNIVM